jgi:hypothetical protein
VGGPAAGIRHALEAALRPRHVKVASAESRSLVYAPRHAGPHPVLCFLHGADEHGDGGGQNLDRLLRNGSPAWHAERGSDHLRDFIVVCPQLERRRRWETSDAARVCDLVAAAAESRGGDLSRLVLSGFSLGGEGVFQVASASSLRWAALWAVDPALQRVPPFPGAGARVWVHHGQHQPGGAAMAGFSEALGLVPWSPDAPAGHRVVKALPVGHAETCREAFADAPVFGWLVS